MVIFYVAFLAFCWLGRNQIIAVHCFFFFFLILADHNSVKLEINYRKENPAKPTNTERLKNMLLSNQWITREVKDEIKKILVIKENTMTQNLLVTAKAVLRGKFVAILGNKKNIR